MLLHDCMIAVVPKSVIQISLWIYNDYLALLDETGQLLATWCYHWCIMQHEISFRQVEA